MYVGHVTMAELHIDVEVLNSSTFSFLEET